MSCSCRNEERRLLVQFDPQTDWGDQLGQFNELRQWELTEQPSHFSVTVGGPSPYRIASDVVNFLRAIVEPQQLKSISARWETTTVEPNCCHQNVFPAKQKSERFLPIEQLAPLDATPLVELLRGKRITTYFQPVFTSDGETVWGYECLMRGLKEDGSLVYPGDLLTWANQERLTFMLDRVCRETHIRNAARLLPADTSVLINFLPTAIYEPALCLKSTIAAAKSAGIQSDRIVFEVVETEAVNDREHLMNVLRYYRERGFRVALDDVGEGFSGLSMLAELSPDLIKIDMSLVRSATTSSMHKAVCAALVGIAAECDKLCLAEGIETEEQFELMKSLGVDLFQGYLLGRPSPTPVNAETSALVTG